MSLNDDELKEKPQQNTTPADVQSADALDETAEEIEDGSDAPDTTYGSTSSDVPQDAVAAAKARLQAKVPGKGKGKKGDTGTGKVIQLPGNGLPTIQANNRDLRDVSEDAMKALMVANNPPALFRRGDTLARIIRPDSEAPQIQTLTETALKGRLTRVANWVRVTEKGEASTFPPSDVGQDILALGEWPFPSIERIVEAPVFGADGTMATEPGYHPNAKVWYESDGTEIPPVPDAPTDADIALARERLLVDLLGDFPFVDASARAHAVAVVLHPHVRGLIDGNTPLHIVEAPSPGTGKTLLVDALSVVATGRPPMSITEGGNDEEWRKRVTAALQAGPTYLMIDNLARKLDSSAVASALTSPIWTDRLLGQSRTISIPIRVCWLATGNNPRFSNEIARRAVTIRIDAKVDQPWLREGFRHPELIDWAKANRGDLIWSALVLIRAWIVAGRPPGTKTLGNFESWAKTMGGILAVAGIGGFLENIQEVYAKSDEETQMWREFVHAWWAKHGGKTVGAKDLFALATDDDLLIDVLGEKGERSQQSRLGKALGKMRDRQFGQYRIEDAETDNSKRALYRLVEVPAPPPPPVDGEKDDHY